MRAESCAARMPESISVSCCAVACCDSIAARVACISCCAVRSLFHRPAPAMVVSSSAAAATAVQRLRRTLAR